MKYLLTILSLCLLNPLEAILPPLYETALEMKAILTDQQLGQKLHSGEVIQMIQKNDQGYEILTNQHRLQIDVLYQPPKQPGPAHFKLYFHAPTPIEK